MEMRKQGSEGQGTARSASKSPGGKKQTGEQMPGSTNQQGATANQGANQGATANQGGGAANQQTSQHQQSGGQQPGGQEDLLQHAKNATGEIVNKVQQQAGSQVNRQKETVASEISQVANAVRRVRENLPQEGVAGYVAEYSDKAANSLDRLSNYLRQQDPKRLLDDVQNFGRRQPALLLGGAFLLGFAGARLIRSSMEAASQQSSTQTNMQTPAFTPQNVPANRSSTTPTMG